MQGQSEELNHDAYSFRVHKSIEFSFEMVRINREEEHLLRSDESYFQGAPTRRYEQLESWRLAIFHGSGMRAIPVSIAAVDSNSIQNRLNRADGNADVSHHVVPTPAE